MAHRTALFLALGLAGCIAEPLQTERQAGGIQIENGLVLNGRRLLGRPPNGTTFQGPSSSGRTADGATFHGIRLEGARLVRADGSGPLTEGTTFSGALADGTPLTLMVGQILSDPWDPLYVEYEVLVEENGYWVNACEGGTAVPMQGSWDYGSGYWGAGALTTNDTITFACRNGAIGKCIALGYEPWRTIEWRDDENARRTESMTGLLQACTRVLRADYCGDGVPHTRDGNMIDVSDNYGVTGFWVGEDGEDSGWVPEAEWSAWGATCVNQSRPMSDDEEAPTNWNGYRFSVECRDGNIEPVATCGRRSFAPGEGTVIVTRAPRHW